MSANLDGFNANDHQPNEGFEPMPKDDYTVIATNSEWKDTADTGNSNQYLQFDWQIIEGEYKGRLLWSRLNLKNSNDTAVKIANGDLSAICRAVGVMKPKDSSELYNKALIVSVIVEEHSKKPGVFKNEIKGYKSVSEGRAEAPAETAATSNGSGGKAPWAK